MNWLSWQIRWIMMVSGALIGLVGLMPIYGAFNDAVRRPVLVFAAYLIGTRWPAAL